MSKAVEKLYYVLIPIIVILGIFVIAETSDAASACYECRFTLNNCPTDINPGSFTLEGRVTGGRCTDRCGPEACNGQEVDPCWANRPEYSIDGGSWNSVPVWERLQKPVGCDCNCHSSTGGYCEAGVWSYGDFKINLNITGTGTHTVTVRSRSDCTSGYCVETCTFTVTPTFRQENCCDQPGWDNVKKCGGCCVPGANCQAGNWPDNQHYKHHDNDKVYICDWTANQDSWYEPVENCNTYDNWYDTGRRWWVTASDCMEKEQKEQEYRNYSCSNGSCIPNVTNTRWIDTGATKDKPNGTVCPDDGNSCTNDYCSNGTCIHPAYCSGTDTNCGCTSCANCNTSDGWQDTSNTQWISISECQEKEQRQQQYLDFYCSGYNCASRVTDIRWIDTGNTRPKPNGTACGTDYYDSYVNYCSGDNVRKHRLFHDYYCTNGNCTDHTSWADDQLVENCNNRDGCVATTYRDWYCSGGTCQYTDSPNDPRCIVCECSSGTCCSDNCNFDPSSRICNTQTEYQCSGPACGADYQSRTRNQYCPGNAATCTGTWGSWSGWSTVQDCTNLQKCYTSGSNCRYDASCEAAPSVDINANPLTINQGQSSTLSWTSTNADSCTASNGWSGGRATSGQVSVSPSSTTTYVLTCTGPGGSASDSATVTVSAAPTHRECISNSCVTVAGAGANQCNNDSDCAPPAGPCDTSYPNDQMHACYYEFSLPGDGPPVDPFNASNYRDEFTDTPSGEPAPAPASKYLINHNWQLGSPFGKNDDFGVVWRGNINFNGTQVRLTTQSDDGSKIYFDGILMDPPGSSFWRDHAAGFSIGNWISITPGYHQIMYEYYENNGDAVARLFYELQAANNPPTATNLNRINTDWCNKPPAYFFSWTYSDPNNDSESRFDFQADNNSGFGSPEVNRSYSGLSNPSPSTNNQSVLVATSQLPDYLTYNRTYFWRVRVWDSKGADSGWVNGASFTTTNHHWPVCDFNWIPESPYAGEEVDFSDQSTCYDDSSSGGDCNANDSYSWTFQDADPANSNEQDPATTFQSSGDKQVTLTVTDSDGYSCFTTKTINIGLSLPKWKEIRPW